MNKLLFTLLTIGCFLSANHNYEVSIKRDIWGVPHIYGETNKDVAFGLAYAQAEDNLENMLFHIYLGRAS